VRCREAVAQVRSKHRYSERRICRALGIARSVVRYVPQPRADEAPLRQAIIALAAQYGRYGYRPVTGLLWQQGWQISRSRVERNRPVSTVLPTVTRRHLRFTSDDYAACLVGRSMGGNSRFHGRRASS
jgi:hypothetical protein